MLYTLEEWRWGAHLYSFAIELYDGYITESVNVMND